MSAWNFGLWALLAVANVGILTATSLSYGLGPRAAWVQESHTLIAAFTIGLFAVILVVNVPGFGIGRWVAHFGTAVTVLVTVLLMGLLFYHPHTSAAAPARRSAEALQLCGPGDDADQREPLYQNRDQCAQRAGAGGGLCRRDAQPRPRNHALGVDRGAHHRRDLHPDDGRDARVYPGGEGRPDRTGSADSLGRLRWRSGGRRRL